ncbi:MAG: hypothetical protein IPH94_21815 [Saprospiraceae bacterium]|nr:hypothetical protein [Saprospiraceae bacterium]
MGTRCWMDNKIIGSCNIGPPLSQNGKSIIATSAPRSISIVGKSTGIDVGRNITS